MDQEQLREKVKEFTRFPPRGKIGVYRDTSEFMKIKDGDVLDLNGHLYLVRGEEFEGRFGLDGEPKFWVKRVVDMEDGEKKIIKLVFRETFTMNLAGREIRCYRSPQKESRILRKMKGDPRFMQGFDVTDSAGNNVRILDRIRGDSFYNFINGLEMDHPTYFKQEFPAIFANMVECIRAMAKLHGEGEIHGDIRNDHILVDRSSGRYVWIDFDYSYEWSENPFGVDLFGLGNILLFAVGNGFYTLKELERAGDVGRKLLEKLDPEDCSLFFPNRIINLRKIFDYIPESLNYVLMHFSEGAELFYETTDELLADLVDAEKDIAAS